MQGMKIIVYGAGRLGQRAISKIPRIYGCNIIAAADGAESLKDRKIMGISIIRPAEIKNLDFDMVLIAISREDSIAQVKSDLQLMGIPDAKIEVLKRSGKFRAVWMDLRVDWIKNFAEYERANGIKGNVAECGVYRGDFSKYLNAFYYDRKLYLFDTFEGFDERDVQFEQSLMEKNFLNSKFNEKGHFNDTAIERVMDKMTYPENIVIRQGGFPQSADGIQDTFCFVVLDMDLYQPMIAGLRFFWDKTEKGGAILCHDYFHHSLTGVKQAVIDFENEIGQRIIKAPIGDDCSIVLYK